MIDNTDVDPSALARLRRMGGPEFVVKMIDLFIEEIPSRLAAARQGEQVGNWTAVADGAHSIKSSAMNFGAQTLSEIALKIEMDARAGKTAEIPTLLRKLEQAYQTAKVWLDNQTPFGQQQRNR